MKFAIYGFYFDREFSFNGIKFTPIGELSYQERKKIANDRNRHNLTGYIETQVSDSESFIFSMQAVLTFVQQQDVILVRITESKVPIFYKLDFERRSPGAAPYAFYPELLEEIVQKLYEKLIDSSDPCNEKDDEDVFGKEHNCEFSSLVYKVTEPFHMRKPFIEMTYFLYFSGLEAFCKQYLKSYYKELLSNKAPEAIGRVLEKLELPFVDVHIPASNYNLKNKVTDEHDFILMSVTTYSNLRNSLFHSNKFVVDVEISAQEISKDKYPMKEVAITDYDGYLLRLCNAVILKYIGITNKNLDCTKWHTRFSLIK